MVRFSNSTRYGKGLLYDGENDPLADQARDMLVKRLVETEGFLVFERDNLGGLAFEKSLLEDGASEFVGVDAVIVGSVTEFGRKRLDLWIPKAPWPSSALPEKVRRLQSQAKSQDSDQEPLMMHP